MKTVFLVADFTPFTPALHVTRTFEEAEDLMAELDDHWLASGRDSSNIAICELPVMTTKFKRP